MINLLRKDFILLKKSRGFIIAVLMVLFGAFMWQKNNFYYLWSILMSIYFAMGYINSYDHKYNSEKIFNSLSLKRSTIVIAKYVSVLVFLAFAIGLSIAAMYLLRLLPVAELTRIINLSEISVVIILVAVYISAYLPLYFKLGYMGSRWANFAALILMFSFSGIISSSDPATQNFVARYLGVFVNSVSGNTGLNRGLIIVLLAVLILLISTSASIQIYQKKEF